MKEMKIFLIRHGESTMNVGENYEIGLPDNLVPLTEKGVAQAELSALSLSKYIKDNDIDLSHARVWKSPYERTRQTFDTFNKIIQFEDIHKMDIRENICLVEQQFGLFDSLPEEKWEKLYPNEYNNYKNFCDNQGKFWARLPMGESPFDVALRLKQFMGTIKRDSKKHKIDTLFLFVHGTVLRCFVMQYLNLSPEWYQLEKNPKNCWIRLIEDKQDKGYIYNN